jgi:microcystin-dependent protein
MTALPLIITTAGLARFTAAQVDDDIDLGITSVGLTDQTFVAAPTLTALPGQFREVDTISGEAVGDNVVHMIVRDAAELSYTVRGFGLFLEDGTLFAVYGQEEPMFEKSDVTTMLLAVDMAFPTGDVSSIIFGDTNFLNPPATTTRRGVVELATSAEAIDGESEELAITPATLKAAIDAAIEAALKAHDKFGDIKLFWGDEEDVEDGWAICNGQTVPRSDGSGDVTLPDFRGRTPVGVDADHDLGQQFGAWTKDITTAAAGAHDHPASAAPHVHDFIASGATTAPGGGTSLTLTPSYKTETAGGGTDKTIREFTLAIDGPTEAAATAITVSEDGEHTHEAAIDVTQPSLAVHFIMRI